MATDPQVGSSSRYDYCTNHSIRDIISGGFRCRAVTPRPAGGYNIRGARGVVLHDRECQVGKLLRAKSHKKPLRDRRLKIVVQASTDGAAVSI